jgi:hypothetical protein
MSLPEPESGMVVRFEYQWADGEQVAKERPACVALVRSVRDPRAQAGEPPTLLKEVVYLPISTKPPRADQHAIELAPTVCKSLQLSEERNWIFVSECNVQYWPNDLGRVAGARDPWLYGYIPPRLFRKVVDLFKEEIRRRKSGVRKVHYLPPRSRSR